MTTTTASDHARTSRRRNVPVTDLDQSDEAPLATAAKATPASKGEEGRPLLKKRSAEKTLHTISGNFSRRARSAECQLQQRKTRRDELATEAHPHHHSSSTAKVQSYFSELLQAKDKQMEQLLQRLATLHKFNEQFADENQKLRSDVDTLEQRCQALRQQMADCEQCKKLTAQLATSMEAEQTLTADLDMLQTLVYRLNVQIESYQDRLRNTTSNGSADGCSARPAVADTGGSSDCHPHSATLPNWQKDSLHRHTLAPLLHAYDEMLRDKQQLVQQYSQEFERFTGELKRVLEENNRLQQQHETLKRDMGSWREERTRLQAQLDVCRNKAEAQTRKTDLAKEKLVEVMHCYEQKMQTLTLDMEHLQSAYTRCKADLASLRSVAAQPQDAIANSLQECKELLEQLRVQHSKEKQALERQVAELTTQQCGSTSRSEQLRTENTLLKQQLDDTKTKVDELQSRTASLQRSMDKIKRSRDRLKARLRIALQWAQKLEEGQANIQSTWDALKRLETIVKHKESQVRGLHARHLQEIDKMQRKLVQKEETIRSILKSKLEPAGATATDQER